jgi:tetratricopeptide (TPR) repeat protein
LWRQVGNNVISSIKIYGRHELAIFEQDDEIRIVHLHNPNNVRAPHPEDFNFFSVDDADYTSMDDDQPLDLIIDVLKTERRKHNALTLAIEGLNPFYSEKGRILALSGAHKRMRDENINRFVKHRVFAFPVPQHADFDEAIKLADDEWSLAAELYKDVKKYRDHINHFSKVWTARVTPEIKGHPWSLRLRLADQGGFYKLASDPWKNPDTRVNFLEHKLKKEFQSSDFSLISELLAFPPGKNIDVEAVDGEAGSVVATAAENTDWENDVDEPPERNRKSKKAKKDREDSPQDQQSEALGSLTELLSSWPDHGNNIADDSFEKIQRQLGYITGQIHNGIAASRIYSLIRDLIHFQMECSKKEQMAKSLCAIASAWEQRSQWEPAEELLSLACDLSPNDPVPETQLANLYQQQNKLQEAISMYEYVISRFPDNVVARNGLAETWRQRGDLDQAARQYEETISRFPDNLFARNGLAETWRQRGDLDQAARQYEETISRFPADVVARTSLAETWRQRGDLDQAARQYEETISRFPDDVFASNGLAETWRQRGDLDQAARQYEETISRFPDDVVARTGLAETWRQRGDFDQAARQYEETISRFPDNVFARTGLAETWRQRGDLDQAARQYEETISRFPADVVARSGLAETWRQRGDLDQAVRQYEETISRFPDDVFARNGLAETWRQRGDLDQAARQYEETISRFPADVVARTGLAETWRQRGDLDQAARQYEETISRFPDDVVARNGLASLLVVGGEYSKAQKILQRDKYQSQSDWISFHILAFSFIREGQFAHGLRLLEQGLAEVPFPAQKKFFATALAAAKIKAGAYRDALNILKQEDYDRFGAKPIELRLLTTHCQLALGQRQQDAFSPYEDDFQLSPLHRRFKDKLAVRYTLNGSAKLSTEEVKVLDDEIMDDVENLILSMPLAA